MSPADIVQKLWNYYNVLRDDLSACVHAQAGGISYLPACHTQAGGDYVEQLTYLLFLRWQMSGQSRRINKKALFRKNMTGPA